VAGASTPPIPGEKEKREMEREMEMEKKAARAIIERLRGSRLSRKEFTRLKYCVSREKGLRRVLKDHEILAYLRQEEGDLAAFLRRKAVRGASGVYIVAVMTKPRRCPRERPCIYCPGGVDYGTPQSYLGKEPALMRGLQTGFDPYLQVMYRLDQYAALGHSPSKVQLIIMGGTFPAAELDYQEWFVTRCLEAMNHYPRSRPGGWTYLEDAQRRNERSRVKCIGITMETRPDWAGVPQTDRMLRLGATLVELGVQTTDDQILRRIRGHGVEDVVRATRVLRDSGLKVGYHIMPGLPGSDRSRDLEVLRTIFSDPRFRPDYLKIYPTLVIRGTPLYDSWRAGGYEALSSEEAADLLVRAHQHFPSWVRVSRIQRDVPADIIEGGVKKSNLREIVEGRLRSAGLRCSCIRCREVGLALTRGEVRDLDGVSIDLHVETYEAGGGIEKFISAEDGRRNLLIGFLRLRIPSEQAHRREVEGAGVVRELHVYGQQVPVGEKAPTPSGFQHRGWGSALLSRAEEVVSGYGLRRIAVLPGVGVRPYYRRRGYRKRGPFMVKDLEA